MKPAVRGLWLVRVLCVLSGALVALVGLAPAAAAAADISGGGYAGSDGAGFHVAVWVRPESAPHLTVRWGARLEQSGAFTQGAAEASLLYEPPATALGGAGPGVWRWARPYAGAGVESVWRSAGPESSGGGSLYAVVGARWWLERHWWMWAELRYSVSQWGSVTSRQARVAAGFGVSWR